MSGCTLDLSTPVDPGPVRVLDPKAKIRMTMALKVNGQAIMGMGVVKRAASYAIEGRTAGSFDLLKIRTPHREIVGEDQGEDFDYRYIPDPTMEMGYGAMLIEGNDKGKGRHSLGFLDFEDDAFRLMAMVRCNGVALMAVGVAVCQSKSDLVQAVEFSEDVVIAGDEGCAAPLELGAHQFEFKLKAGLCVYRVRAKSGLELRFTTYGYDTLGLEKD